MNKLVMACLAGIAGLAVLYGCDPSHSAQIEVTSFEVHDWTSPKDGKTYVVAAPTWKNTGPAVARTVYMVASIKGADGKDEVLVNGDKPLYYGGEVEPGTEVKPVREPEDVLVLGEKEELTKKYGSVTKDKVTIEAMGSEEKYEPKEDKPA